MWIKDIKLIKVTFSGIFNNVKITENFMINNRVIKTTTKAKSLFFWIGRTKPNRPEFAHKGELARK